MYKVSKKTYEKVMNACREQCVLCGRTYPLQLHHIVYRSEDRKLIDEPSNLVMLCLEHHLLVHTNKKYWKPILLERAKNIYGNMEGH